MEFKELSRWGKNPVIGVGNLGLGGKHSADFSNDESSIGAIKTAIDLGMTHY